MDDSNYDYEITLVPVTNFAKVKYGLITPEGKLYACGFTDHCYLQSELERTGKLEPNDSVDYSGCVHVSNFDFDCLRNYSNDRKVTQKQLDTMSDYMVAHNQQFDFSIVEIIDATKTRKPKTRTAGPVFQSVPA